ncbi:MAG: hypothetical protein ACRDJY_05880 [Thermoleophilaceae bacterium]
MFAPLVAALCALLMLASTAAAQQRLGTNLANHVPNANFDCRWRPSVVGPQFFGGPDNCTYVNSTPGAQSTGAPGPGVIVRVRVRAAAPVGPMQVTVARAIRSTTAGFTCCFYNGESQVFTPAPNAVTAIPMRLPVSSEFHAEPPNQGFEAVDYLGLTVLANNVAIPGQYPGNDALEGSLGFFPRLTPQDVTTGRVDGYGNSLIPLLNVDFVPICLGGGAGSARAAQGRCMGALSFRGRGGSLAGSTAQVPLLCNLTIRCRGRLSLRSLGGTSIGSTRVRIGQGRRRSISVDLNEAGQDLVRGKNRVKVKARAKVKGARAAKRKVTLRR